MFAAHTPTPIAPLDMRPANLPTRDLLLMAVDASELDDSLATELVSRPLSQYRALARLDDDRRVRCAALEMLELLLVN